MPVNKSVELTEKSKRYKLGSLESSIWAVVGKCASGGIIATFATARSQSEGQVGGPVELLR